MASASCLRVAETPIRPSGTFPRDAGEGMHLLPTRGSFCLRSKDSPHSRQHPANACHHHSAQGADRLHASTGGQHRLGAEGDRWRVRHACASPIPPSALRAPSPAMRGKGCISCQTRGSFCLRSKDSPHSRQHPANVCHHSAQGADRRHASPGLRQVPVGCGSRSVASASWLHMTDAPIRPSGTFPRDAGEGMHLLPTRGSFCLRSKDFPDWRQHPANVCHHHSAQRADRRHASPCLRPAPVAASCAGEARTRTAETRHPPRCIRR